MLNNAVYYGAGSYSKVLLCCVMVTSAVSGNGGELYPAWNVPVSAFKTPANVFGFVYSPSAGSVQGEAKRANLAKLDEIAALKENWNGYGAAPFSSGLLARARSLIASLPIQPEVFPTADDSIQIEFDGPERSYLEIQITEGAEYDALRIDRQGLESVFRVPADSSALGQLVRDFYGSELS